MGKRKSNIQKREIAAKQKINKARKAEKLRIIQFRNFDDMTPVPQWEIERIWEIEEELSKMYKKDKLEAAELLEEDKEIAIRHFRHNLLTKKFNWKSDNV